MGFKTAPPEIQRAFTELKQKLGKPISLHKISGNYYVYEYASARDVKKGKVVIKTSYLGKISDDGRFVPKDGEIQTNVDAKPIRVNKDVDEREAIALRNLSMNGRMSMAKLAKRIGMSTTGARHFVKRLEEKYNVRYFAELDMLKLGYLRYIAFIKFEGQIPTIDVIKRSFNESPYVTFVAMVKGKYDMIIIFYLENTKSLTHFIYDWRSSVAMPEYTARWYVTPLSMATGITIPLRHQFIETLKNRVWTKSKESRTKILGQLSNVEYKVVSELITSGNKNFYDIDKKYSLSSGQSNYAFFKLKRSGLLERITLTIEPPKLKYNALFITETNNYKTFIANRDSWLADTISFEIPLINKYAYRGDMGLPDGIFYIKPIFENQDFHMTLEKVGRIHGTQTEGMIITDVVIGSLCYRNFDPTHTKIYEILVDRGKLVKIKKEDYQ